MRLKIYSPNNNGTVYLQYLNNETFLSTSTVSFAANNKFETVELTKTVPSNCNNILIAVTPNINGVPLFIDDINLLAQ